MRKRIWLAAATLAMLFSSQALPAATRHEGDLARRAELGFRAQQRDGSLMVVRLDPESPAALAGLREGDELLAIDGQAFSVPYVGEDLVRRLDGGREARLEVRRGGNRIEIRFVPESLPLEEIEGLDTLYGVVETPDGARLRTVITRPARSRAPLPAIFFIQWVSCDPIEPLEGDPTGDLLRGLAQRSGMALVRVERSASGDSEGPPCHELDYDTEVAHYRHALSRLRESPLIDGRRIVLFGDSLGSTVAPLVARGNGAAGVVVSGGGALTYVERMINFDRIAFERLGTDPREIDQLMRQHIEFHVRYLLHDQTPEQIVRERPDLEGVWAHMRGTGAGVHYGRPYDYHQQAAKQNLLAAWSEVDAPVLVLYGEYDQFEMPHGHEVIVQTLNRRRPGSARFIVLPKGGHSFDVYSTPEEAAAWEHGQGAPELALAEILEWLEREVGIKPASADGLRTVTD